MAQGKLSPRQKMINLEDHGAQEQQHESVVDESVHEPGGPIRGEYLWVVDRARGAAVRVDSWGRGWYAEELPLPGVKCARVLADGGLLAAGGGAVLRLDARGRVACGQGGFSFVADL